MLEKILTVPGAKPSAVNLKKFSSQMDYMGHGEFYDRLKEECNFMQKSERRQW